MIGPNGDGEIITDLALVAAPELYKIPNSLLDFEIEATIPVDFLIRYQRTFGGIETTVQIPAGYRDGRIRLVGMKRK